MSQTPHIEKHFNCNQATPDIVIWLYEVRQELSPSH